MLSGNYFDLKFEFNNVPTIPSTDALNSDLPIHINNILIVNVCN